MFILSPFSCPFYEKTIFVPSVGDADIRASSKGAVFPQEVPGTAS